MKPLLFVLILLATNTALAQDDFVYNDHGKRDPFKPLVSATGLVITYDEDLSVGDLALEGIIADSSGNNAALVNGKIVKVGDQIGPYTVDVITLDHVEFLKDNQRYTLKMRKGGL